MTSMYDVLRASKGLPVDDIFAELWGRKLSGDYTIVTYTGTLPATLTGTKAGYLNQYKIYGNIEQTGTPTPENPIVPSECGERTGNLFDENATDTNNGYDNTGRYLTNMGTTGGNAGGTWRISEYIAIEPNSEYSLSGFTTGVNPSYCLYDVNKDFISGARYASESVLAITTPSNARYLRFSRNINTDDATMLNTGSTALLYEPYGYKLPLTSAGQDVDIYLGDDTLSTDEYVDSGTGKVYRMVDGVLTPIDPPMPFPQIPTTANSTTISWAGSGLAPSEVEFEYERRR